MATTRKKTTGFGDPLEEKEETSSFTDHLIDAGLEEESVPTPSTPALVSTSPRRFVEESITPTEDSGPRFVSESTPPPAPPKAPELQPRPKRHPRNVPRFSRTR